MMSEHVCSRHVSLMCWVSNAVIQMLIGIFLVAKATLEVVGHGH